MEGNQMKMREALVKIRRELNSYCTCLRDSFLEIERIVAAALSAPPRQCDVGTPEEQEKRYKLKREVYHTLTLTNALAWAQTPYEEEGGAE